MSKPAPRDWSRSKAMDEFGYGDEHDWYKYCRGELSPEEVDAVNFSFLFTDFTDAQFQNVFACFPQGDQLFERYQRYAKPASTGDIEPVLQREIQNMCEVCRKADEPDLGEWLQNADIENLGQISSEQQGTFYRSSGIFLEFMTTLSDYTIEFYIQQKPSFWDIFHAFYMHTGNDFRLSYSLCHPLLEAGELFTEYLNIRNLGYDYCLTEDGIKLFLM